MVWYAILMVQKDDDDDDDEDRSFVVHKIPILNNIQPQKGFFIFFDLV